MGTSTDPFLTRAEGKAEALKREIALLEAQEAGVRRRRLELEKDAADWARAVELYTEAMGMDNPRPVDVVSDRSKETVAELIARYLTEQPAQTGKVTAIAAFLVEVGRYPSGPDAAGQNYSMAYNALLRNRDRFVKAGRGEWRLVGQEPNQA